MKKYKLINTKTNEEHLCDKVTIDGFDYYVSDEEIKGDDWYIAWETINDIESNHIVQKATNSEPVDMYSWASNYKKVIATNNPNIDIPKVVDDVERLAFKYTKVSQAHRRGFIDGYNKCKEEFGSSDEDMIEFAVFYKKHQDKSLEYWGKDLFKVWKEQQPITLYYES